METKGKLHPLSFNDISVHGDLYRRAIRNFDRLEEERYQPHRVFLSEEESLFWPGDTEGRTLLALVLLSQSTHRPARYLDEILWKFPKMLNSRGYFGTIHLPDAVNEQQLASHGWVLRALCEAYQWHHEDLFRQWIDRILDNLALPTTGLYRQYPVDPNERTHTGGFAGRTVEQIGKWQLSSDIGCYVIFLDGLVHCFERFPSPKLKLLIDEMVERFLQIDLLAIKAQTHATLTALRALLRYYSLQKECYLLDHAVKRYQLYTQEGMTENYANYNWFRRGEWTEPCAVIDSFIVAVRLWQFTENPRYLADAHHIYYNALCRGQRANGGFGTDTCVGVAGPFIENSVYEAYWCCTMRGGEGLSRAIQFQYFVRENALYIAFYHSNQAKLCFGERQCNIRLHSDYPHDGNVFLQITSSDLTVEPELLFFKPPNCDRFELKKNGNPIEFKDKKGFLAVTTSLQEGDTLNFHFAIQHVMHDTLNRNSISGYQSLRHGPLLLGCETGREGVVKSPLTKEQTGSLCYSDTRSGVHLKPFYDLLRVKGDKNACKQQLLFIK
ncbi:hypothetical protein GF407_16620 [candidate division KSB1 bacterium]|nr:hypothetical protein [candidate division KSB1 bacterium]